MRIRVFVYNKIIISIMIAEVLRLITTRRIMSVLSSEQCLIHLQQSMNTRDDKGKRNTHTQRRLTDVFASNTLLEGILPLG